ncbi:hypothetical protein [Nocardia abscessus]|uniref:hypothetical protein n=1 Tax=Nocardia abscessus TaxID=120957 RepID=UPI002454CDF7|nr:hypothetical protein [Nocardia abscessus]
MSNFPTSLVAHLPTTSMWRWLVIPASNPNIYVPFPTEAAADAAADEFDRGIAIPEWFIHLQVTPAMRAALKLPEPEKPPKLTRLPGHTQWRAVSFEAGYEAVADREVTVAEITIHEPGQEPRTVYYVATPHALRKAA